MGDRTQGPKDVISLSSDDYFETEAFLVLFRKGMSLVEETAAYIGGDGKSESRALTQDLSLRYSVTSMQLTARVMKAMSWLLLMRGRGAGEITDETVRIEKAGTNFADPPETPEDVLKSGLPERLVELIRASHELRKKILELDARFFPPTMH